MPIIPATVSEYARRFREIGSPARLQALKEEAAKQKALEERLAKRGRLAHLFADRPPGPLSLGSGALSHERLDPPEEEAR